MALTLKKKNDLTVALLISDLQDAKSISDVFRKIGILPHVYQDIKSFWHGTLTSIPALCVVDVTAMSEGELNIGEHPLVKAGELPLCFFYSDTTEALLYSTYNISNLGTLKKTAMYEGPVKAILKRLNRINSAEVERENLKIENRRYISQVSKLMSQAESLKEKIFFEERLNELCGKLELYKQHGDFIEIFEKLVDGIEEISEFSIYQLSPGKQKLTSAVSTHKKHKRLPGVWLGKGAFGRAAIFWWPAARFLVTASTARQPSTMVIRAYPFRPDTRSNWAAACMPENRSS